MTKREVIEMLTAKAECIRREASGTDIDCNLRNCDECDLCYKQGTTGDQMEALRVAISALQAQDVPDTNVGDMISMQKVIDLWDKYHQTITVDAIAYDKALKSLPSAQKKGYTKADYITALHKEYGCSLTRAEEAHQKALEYLRNTSMMKG